MTRILPLRLMIWQNSHLRFTDALTFILTSPVALSRSEPVALSGFFCFSFFPVPGYRDTKKVRNHPFPSESVGTKVTPHKLSLSSSPGAAVLSAGGGMMPHRKRNTLPVFSIKYTVAMLFSRLFCVIFANFFLFCGKYFSGNGADRDKSCGKYCRSACKIDFCVLN